MQCGYVVGTFDEQKNQDEVVAEDFPDDDQDEAFADFPDDDQDEEAFVDFPDDGRDEAFVDLSDG